MLVKRYGLQLDDSGMVQHHGDLTVFPAEYFSPKNLFEKKVEMGTETVCDHHFEGQWVKRNPLFVMKRAMHRIVQFLLGKRVHGKDQQRTRLNYSQECAYRM